MMKAPSPILRTIILCALLGSAALAQSPDGTLTELLQRLRILRTETRAVQLKIDEATAKSDRDLDQVPLVLMYHDIVDDTTLDLTKTGAIDMALKLKGKGPEEPSSDVLRTDFQDQLTWLRQHGYHTVTIDRFYRAMIDYPNSKLPPKSVLITFDDGYLGNRFIKDDLMKHTYGYGATFFIHSHYTGDAATPEEKKSNPWAKSHMTEEDLQDLEYDRQMPGFNCNDKLGAKYSECYQIESHTWSHPKLDELIEGPGTTWDGLPTTLEKELRAPLEGPQSLKAYLAQETNWTPVPGRDDLLEKQITPHPNVEINDLAYPFGRFTRPGRKDLQVMQAVQKAGYRMAFMIDWPNDANGRPWKIHNIYAIPRMEMTLKTWVREGDPRMTSVPLNFEEQIRAWKTKYRETLLSIHEAKPDLSHGVKELLEN